jgi:hypothetical protein
LKAFYIISGFIIIIERNNSGYHQQDRQKWQTFQICDDIRFIITAMLPMAGQAAAEERERSAVIVHAVDLRVD